jgi:hypothetical protein
MELSCRRVQVQRLNGKHEDDDDDYEDEDEEEEEEAAAVGGEAYGDGDGDPCPNCGRQYRWPPAWRRGWPPTALLMGHGAAHGVAGPCMQRPT